MDAARADSELHRGVIPADLLVLMPATDAANLTFTDLARDQVESEGWLFTHTAQRNADGDTDTGAAVATGVVLE